MNEITPLILTGFIGIGVGIAIGILVCSLRGERKASENNRSTEKPLSQGLPPVTAPVSADPIPSEHSIEDNTQPLSMNVIDVMARVIQPNMAELEEPPLSITAQIDEILQEKLEESPKVNQAVRLKEDPGKGVVVLVGLDRYEGVDSVPDVEIRSLIRSAVTEWENRVGVDDREA
jgi:hypothetical protein